jgi:hypothetical protein
MTRGRSEGLTMSEETRITANPLSEESRITADSPLEADTRICLTPLPKEEATQPKPSRRFWKWLEWVWFILFLATLSINVAIFRQDDIEKQQNQAKIDELIKKTDRLLQENQAKIELKKEANRLIQAVVSFLVLAQLACFIAGLVRVLRGNDR